MADFHANDSGTTLEFTMVDESGVPLPLGGYTSLTVLIRRPGGDTLVKSASLVTDGSDGKLKYVLGAGDLNDPGSYHFQPRVVIPAGTWHGAVAKVKVLANLD